MGDMHCPPAEQDPPSKVIGSSPAAGIGGSAAKSVRLFRSSEAYVEAMKEDLAKWLNALYGLGLPNGGDGFLTGLATGTTLCQHANAAHSVVPGSFMARDNVATFIGWCRAELGVPEVLMFETEDPRPEQLRRVGEGAHGPLHLPRPVSHDQSLGGKYRVGGSSLLIFVRVLRSHVIVRVGGGWDTLEHYVDKHDSCRCSSTAHRPPQLKAGTFSPQRVSPTPVPELVAQLQRLSTGAPAPSRYSGDSDSTASSAQSGGLLCPRSEDSGTGPQRERPSERVTTGTPASMRRPPSPHSQSRGRLDRGRPHGAPGGRGGQLLAPGPAWRARSHSPEEQAVLLVRWDRDGQRSWVPQGRGSGGSGRSSPQTPCAHSPAALRPPRAPSPSPELSTTPASVFHTPLQLDPKQEQPLFRRLEEEFLANARALDAAAGGTPTGPAPDPVRAPDPQAPDSAYCSSSVSSSSLSILGSKCGQLGYSGRMANGLPRP
ncbi:GAS2-like protein 1 [Camelus dromedarius]|uniref:GAS2-like protein 1 n=1 Tax=Camelus dromedarius TaxID=9838 RepID=A0A5N4C553_CAMDR|nr:GAS2-like protein 1 [Camelus dromedarius]